MPLTRIEKFLLRNGGELTEEKRSQKRREVRRDEKSEEKRSQKRRLEPEMSGDYSNGEGSVGHEADFVDATVDREVELRLPLEVNMDPDWPREDIRIHSGAVAPNAVDLGQEEQRRFETPNSAMPKWPGHRLSLPLDTEPRTQPPGAAAHVAGPGTDRRRLGAANSTYPGLGAGMRMPTYFNFRKTP